MELSDYSKIHQIYHREVHRKDIIMEIGDKLSTPARFEKAVQHARDEGLLVDEPKDIGILMRELNKDFEEHVDEIKNLLYANYRKEILRVANRGFAEWYKAKLFMNQVMEVARDTLDQVEPIEGGSIIRSADYQSNVAQEEAMKLLNIEKLETKDEQEDKPEADQDSQGNVQQVSEGSESI